MFAEVDYDFENCHILLRSKADVKLPLPEAFMRQEGQFMIGRKGDSTDRKLNFQLCWVDDISRVILGKTSNQLIKMVTDAPDVNLEFDRLTKEADEREAALSKSKRKVVMAMEKARLEKWGI